MNDFSIFIDHRLVANTMMGNNIFSLGHWFVCIICQCEINLYQPIMAIFSGLTLYVDVDFIKYFAARYESSNGTGNGYSGASLYL
jgi:hypothetical protein